MHKKLYSVVLSLILGCFLYSNASTLYADDATPEVGTHTLNWERKSLYEFHYAVKTDSSGSQSSILNNGNKVFIDNLIQVWCIEPYVATKRESKYEETIVSEDIYASVLTYLAETADADNTFLITATAQALLWQHLGTTDIFDNTYVKHYGNGESGEKRDFTAEEKAIIAKFTALVDKTYADYTQGMSAQFQLQQNTNAVLYNNELTVFQNTLPSSIVLTGSKEALAYYANGMMDLPDGISAVIDEVAGTLTLTLPENLAVGSYTLKLSMLPENRIGKTTQFISNYGKQKVSAYRFTDPKWETLTINVKKASDFIPPCPDCTTTAPKTEQPVQSTTICPDCLPETSSSCPDCTTKPSTQKQLPHTGDTTSLVFISIGLLFVTLSITIKQKYQK